MQALKKFSLGLVVVVVLVAVGFFLVTQYSFIFSKTIEGRIIGVDRITESTLIMGRQLSPDAMFSFAVAIEDQETKKVYTASSEDRQWGVAKHCARARAKFYPYPFWNFEKAGTFFNARLLELYDCQKAENAETPATTPGATAPEAAPTPAVQ
ncbi:MAG: hypothetical protein AAB250_07190 [Bdellovibrionota bacterium]